MFNLSLCIGIRSHREPRLTHANVLICVYANAKTLAVIFTGNHGNILVTCLYPRSSWNVTAIKQIL